jgi:hypothetical protein
VSVLVVLGGLLALAILRLVALGSLFSSVTDPSSDGPVPS